MLDYVGIQQDVLKDLTAGLKGRGQKLQYGEYASEITGEEFIIVIYDAKFLLSVPRANFFIDFSKIPDIRKVNAGNIIRHYNQYPDLRLKFKRTALSFQKTETARGTGKKKVITLWQFKAVKGDTEYVKYVNADFFRRVKLEDNTKFTGAAQDTQPLVIVGDDGLTVQAVFMPCKSDN